MLVFRPHSSGLKESIEEIKSFGSFTELADHVLSGQFIAGRFDVRDVALKPYCEFDKRTSWRDTWLVVIEGFGPVGYVTADDDPNAIERTQKAYTEFAESTIKRLLGK